MQRTKNFEIIHHPPLFSAQNWALFDIFVHICDRRWRSSVIVNALSAYSYRIQARNRWSRVTGLKTLGGGGGGLGRGYPSVELEMDNGASNQNDIFLQESSVCIYVRTHMFLNNVIVGRCCLRLVLWTLVVMWWQSAVSCQSSLSFVAIDCWLSFVSVGRG